MFPGDLRSDNAKIDVSFGDGNPWFGQAEELESMISPLFELGVRRERHPEILIARKFKTFRHYANDGGRISIYAHGAADHIHPAAVAVFPNTVTEKHHGFGARCAVCRRKSPT